MATILTQFFVQARVTRGMGRIRSLFGKSFFNKTTNFANIIVGRQFASRVGEFVQFIGRDAETIRIQRFD